MDLKIVSVSITISISISISISNANANANASLFPTRNLSDFIKIPGLHFEDW